MAEDMINNFNIPKNNIFVINNPISNLPKVKTVEPFAEVRKFITVGRLTEVKGHFRLLYILSKYSKPFRYTIIGNGELKEELFQKAKDLGIDKQVRKLTQTDGFFKNELVKILLPEEL